MAGPPPVPPPELRPKRWWLTDGEDTAYGPFHRKDIETRLGRYLIYRRYSNATRRECWRKAGEDPFVGQATVNR